MSLWVTNRVWLPGVNLPNKSDYFGEIALLVGGNSEYDTLTARRAALATS